MASAAFSTEEVPPAKDCRQETQIGHGQKSQGPYKVRRRMGTAGKSQCSVGQSPKGNGFAGPSQGQTQNPKDNTDGNQYCSDQAANPPGHHLVSGAPRQPHSTPALASQNSQPCSSRQPTGSRRKQSSKRGSVLPRGITPPATLGGILLRHASLKGPVVKRHISAQGHDKHGHSTCAVSDLRITNQRSAISKQASRKGPRSQSDGACRGVPEQAALPCQVQLHWRRTSSSSSDPHGLNVQENSDPGHIHNLTKAGPDHAGLAGLSDPDARNLVTRAGQSLHNLAVPEGPIFHSWASRSYSDHLNWHWSAGPCLTKQVALADVSLHNTESVSDPDLHGQALHKRPDWNHPTLTGTDLLQDAKQASPDLYSQATPRPVLQSNKSGSNSDPPGQVMQQGPTSQRGRRQRNRHRRHHQKEYNIQGASNLSCQDTLAGLRPRNPLTQRGQCLKQTIREGHNLSSSASKSHHHVHDHASHTDPDHFSRDTLSGSILRSSASGSGSEHYGQDFQDYPDCQHQFPIRANSEVSLQAVPSYPNLWDLSTQADHGIPSQINTEGSKLHRSASGSCKNVLCYTCQDHNQAMLPDCIGQSSACDCGSDIPGKECQNDPDHHSCTICAMSHLLGCITLEEGPDHCQQQGQNYQDCSTQARSDPSFHATMAVCDAQDPLILGGQHLLQQATHEDFILPSNASGSHQDVHCQTAWAGPVHYSPATLADHVENGAPECGSDLCDQVFKECPDGCQCPIWGSSDLHQSATLLGLNPWKTSLRVVPDFPSLDIRKGQIVHSSASASHHDVSLCAMQAGPDLCNQAPLLDHTLYSIASGSQPGVLGYAPLAGLDLEHHTAFPGPILGSSAFASHADTQAILGHPDSLNRASVPGPILQSRASSSTFDHNVSTMQANPDQQHCYTLAGLNVQGFTPPSRPPILPGLVFPSNVSLAGHDFPGCITYVVQDPCNQVSIPGQVLETSASGFPTDVFHCKIPMDSVGSNHVTLPGHIVHSDACESHPDVQIQAALARLRHPNWANLPCSVLWNSDDELHHNTWGQANQDGPGLPTLPGPVLPSNASIYQHGVLGHVTQADLNVPDTVLCSGASRSTTILSGHTFQAGCDQQQHCHTVADLEFQFPNSPSRGAETLDHQGTPSKRLFNRKASVSSHYLNDHLTYADQDTRSRATSSQQGSGD